MRYWFLFIAFTGMMSASAQMTPPRYYPAFKYIQPYLQRHSDTTYVLNFWATWCAPCVAELPHFKKVQEAYRQQKVKFYFISLDMREQIPTAVLPLLEQLQLQAEVLVLDDPKFNDWINQVDSTWQGSLPATLIYNTKKRLFLEKSIDEATLKQLINSFL